MPFTHKIPQNVTKYESPIIGKFTPRQFIYLAIGGLIIMLLFMLPFPTFIKFAGGIIVAPVTVLLAIVSFDGRRTDVWIVNFLQAVSKPTQRVWQKEEVPPQFLLPSYVVPHHEVKYKPRKQAELDQFLDFWRTQERQRDYSEEEKDFLQKISLMGRYYQKEGGQESQVKKPLAGNTHPSQPEKPVEKPHES